MNGETDFIVKECRDIEITIRLLEDLLSKESWTPVEIIAVGTLLQNVYMGIESILRCRLKQRNIAIKKSEQWHKALLLESYRQGFLTEFQNAFLKDLLEFRHLHVHGYAHRLNSKRLRELAEPVPTVVREYLKQFLPE